MTVLASLLAATLALALLGWWSRAHIRERAKYRLHREEFFSRAKALIENEGCPLEVALTLRYLGETMNRFLVLGFIVCAAITRGRLARRRPGRLSVLLEESPREIQKAFYGAFHEALLAVSYRSVLFGNLIRARSAKQPDQVDKTVIGDLIRYGKRHDKSRFELLDHGLCLKAA